MAVIGNMNERSEGGKNYHQACLDEKLLQAVKPSTKKGVTIIRIIPEVIDGRILPMVNGSTPTGLDFSNFHLEPVTVNCGVKSRFSGIARASDRVDEDNVNMVFPGLFIRLKGRLKKNEIPTELEEEVRKLFEGEMKAPLRNTPDIAMVQCVVSVFNDKRLEKPKAHQAIFLTQTAAAAISEVLAEAHQAGIDVFDPQTGREIILTPEKDKRSGIFYYNAELGNVAPINEEDCKKLWVPWEKALKLRTYDDMLRQAVSCFGRDIVEYAFEDDVQRIFDTAPVAVQAAVMPRDSYSAPVSSETAPTAGAPAAMQLDMDLSDPIDSGDDDDEPEERTTVSSVASDAGESGNAVAAPQDAAAMAANYESLLDED